MTQQEQCTHNHFRVLGTVNRIDDGKEFCVDFSVWCDECGKRFKFLGLPIGLHPNKPTMSFDQLEVRMPIEESEEFYQ